jgi:uncharacterized protein
MSENYIWSERDILAEPHQSAWLSQQYQCGGQCACESGISTRAALSPAVSALIRPEIIPKRYSQLYLTYKDGYLAVYNPNGRFGVAVLSPFTAQLFLAITPNNVDNLQNLQAQLDAPLEQIWQALCKLETAELVYTSVNEPPVVFHEAQNVAVWMHVTNQCNLRCTYCYIQKTTQHMPLELGKQALAEIFATALKNGRKEVLLKFAGGEALLEFNLVRSLTNYARQLAAKTGLKVQPIILTNGTTIKPEVAQIMHDEDYVAAISLDGLAEYNDRTRPLLGGQGSFRQIERGLNLLLEYQVRFNVSVVVSKYNLPHLPVLTRYLLERNLAFTFNFFRENELAEQNLAVDNTQLIEGISRAYDVVAEMLPSYSLMNAILDRVQFNAPHLQACGVGTNYIVVKHTGEIVNCQMHMQKRGLAKVGQGHDLLTVVRERNFISSNARSVEQKEGCSSCQWRFVCAGGCPIITFASQGRFDTRSPFCASYKALIPQVLDLEVARIIKHAVAKSYKVDNSLISSN